MSPSVSLLTAILVCAAAALAPDAVMGQRAAKEKKEYRYVDRGWYTLGMGAGLPYKISGVTSANFGRRRVIEIAARGVVDFSLGGESNSVSAFSVAVGRSKVNRIGRLAATVGPALVFSDRYYPERNRREYATTGGIMVAGQAIFTPIIELGIGLDGFVILNPNRPATGLSLTLVFEGMK